MPPDTLPLSPDTATGYTVADLMRRWRVGQDKILGFIRTGKLRALNLATNINT
jgi:hypothetical protein